MSWPVKLIDGYHIVHIAIPLLAIYTINPGAFEVGLISLFQSMSSLLVMLWAAAWIASRLRIPALLVSDVMQAILLVAITALALTKPLTVVTLVVLVFIAGVCSGLFELAYYSILPSIVHRSDLLNANGRLQASLSLTLVTRANPGRCAGPARQRPVCVAGQR